MKRIFTALIFTLTLSLSFAPTVLAQNNCAFDQADQKLCNPIKSTDLKDLLLNLTRYLMGVIGVVSIVMIVVAGFRMVISGGNEGSVKAAKNQLTWAVLGLVLALLAYTIVAVIQNIIKGA